MAKARPGVVPLTADTEHQATMPGSWSTFNDQNTVEEQPTALDCRIEDDPRILVDGWLRQGINISLASLKQVKDVKETYLDQEHPIDNDEFKTSEKGVETSSPPEDLEYVVVYNPEAPILEIESSPSPYSWWKRGKHKPPKNKPPPMSQVIPYPQCQIYSRSGNYTVTANGVALDAISLTSYDYVHFAVPPGEGVLVDIVITLKSGKTVAKYRVSPKKLNLPVTASGSELQFTMKSHDYVIAQLNDHRELLVLCDPAETDVPPPSGSGVYNVLDPAWGADYTGVYYSTSAFQNALNVASASVESDPEYEASRPPKQAIIYVPAGLYMLENVVLPSNTALYLEPGAVLRFSGIARDYYAHWHKDSQNRDITWWISTAFESSNIRIYGRGTIDGNGWTSTNSVSPKIGNNIIVPIACRGFTLEGVIVRESSSWSITPVRCSDVTVTRVKMLNRLDMGENDCIDPMECQRVTVTKCIGISLDDPFSTKTWANETDIALSWPGQPQVQTDIAFEDCLSWTRCFGFKVGQGVMQPQRNISFRGCVVYDAAVGLGVNHRYGTAAAEDILFEGCEVERVSLTLVGRRTWFAAFTEMGNEALGVGPVRRVRVEGCRVWDRGGTRPEIVGWDGEDTWITDVTFKNVEMMDLVGVDRPDGVAKTLEELGFEEAGVKFADGLEVLFD